MSAQLKKILFFSLLGSFSSLFATPDGAYVGAQLGRSNLAYTEGNQSLAPAHEDGRLGFAWNIFSGFQFNQNFALQADYTEFHDVNYSDLLGVEGAKAHIDQRAADIVAKLMYPFAAGFDLFATVGAAYVRVEAGENNTASLAGANLHDHNAIRPTYGLGVSTDFTPNLAGQIAWTQITKGGGIERSNFLGAGLAYYFR